MTKNFLRRIWSRHSKLGKKRKKKQKWRRPTGRDNKMREKRKGYPAIVSVGYKKKKETSGKIMNKIIIKINNIKDLEKLTSEKIGVLGNLGKKKKIEIAIKAKEKKFEIYNLNPEKFLKKTKKKGVKNEPKK